MKLEGTVINGVIVLDGNPSLPEGVRVRVELGEPLPPDHPLAPQDPATERVLLQESAADMKAGRTRPFEEAMSEVAARHQLPPVPPE